MTNKFDQRAVGENFIVKLRKLGEDISALKFRESGGSSVVVGGGSGSDAGDITYTPAVNADWNGSADPGDVDAALDQLAERAKDMESFAGISSPVSYGFEVGMIMQWSGAIVDIPTGWQLCDGTNGTPDLRDKFVVGAGSTYAPGDTGGAATHDHDYTQVLNHTHPVVITDPTHNHTQNAHNHTQNPHSHGLDEGTTDGSGTFMDRSNAAAATTAVTNDATAVNIAATATNIAAATGITAATSNPAGGAASGTTTTENNLPPYYALAYIMCMELGAGVAVHVHTSVQNYPSHGLNATIAAATTRYLPTGLWGLNATGYATRLSFAGKIKKLYVRIITAQPGTGSLVANVNVNGVASALNLTIPASSVAGEYSEVVTEVTVAAGDRIVIAITNNASGASAQINVCSVDFEFDIS